VGDSADCVFFLEEGEIELLAVSVSAAAPGTGTGTGTGAGSAGDEGEGEGEEGDGAGQGSQVVERVNKISGGGIFGESAFFLGAAQSLRALTLSPCAVWSLSREAFARMELQQPRLCLLVQHSLVKSLAISAESSLFRQFPETAFSNLFADAE